MHELKLETAIEMRKDCWIIFSHLEAGALVLVANDLADAHDDVVPLIFEAAWFGK